MDKDLFNVLSDNNIVSKEIKIKNSRFICHLQYAEDIETAKVFISTISAYASFSQAGITEQSPLAQMDEVWNEAKKNHL